MTTSPSKIQHLLFSFCDSYNETQLLLAETMYSKTYDGILTSNCFFTIWQIWAYFGKLCHFKVTSNPQQYTQAGFCLVRIKTQLLLAEIIPGLWRQIDVKITFSQFDKFESVYWKIWPLEIVSDSQKFFFFWFTLVILTT